jgi:membrane-bound metal-dependent hydrolase YbcI (DUF457 family)
MTARPGTREAERLVCALAAPAVALLADSLLRQRRWPTPLTALMDETAHLATAQALVTAVAAGREAPFRLGALLGAVLIDADHLPRTLRPCRPRRYAGRPAPHSLATLAGLGGAAMLLAGTPRQVVLGAAAGLATHLARDAVTGGVPLGWPLSRRRVRAPYAFYAGALLGLAANSARRLAASRSDRGCH